MLICHTIHTKHLVDIAISALQPILIMQLTAEQKTKLEEANKLLCELSDDLKD